MSVMGECCVKHSPGDLHHMFKASCQTLCILLRIIFDNGGQILQISPRYLLTALQKDLDIDEALARYDAIKRSRKKNPWVHILCSGIGAAALCYFLGGGSMDCAAAFLRGLRVWGFLTALERFSLSKVLLHIVASMIAAGGCVIMLRLGLVQNLDKAIVGAIIPLLPSVAFVNGVRDLVDQNYISGGVRLLDAILLFTCIATGVYLALQIGGGI